MPFAQCHGTTDEAGGRLREASSKEVSEQRGQREGRGPHYRQKVERAPKRRLDYLLRNVGGAQPAREIRAIVAGKKRDAFVTRRHPRSSPAERPVAAHPETGTSAR